MSTTPSSFEAAAQFDPADAFDDYVFDNPEICSECFERIKRIETDTVAYGSVGTRKRRWSERTGAGVHGQGVDGGTRVSPVIRGRTFCEECGSQSGRAYSDILSRLEATERAHTLADRLAEEGISVDETVLAYAVYRLKSDDRLQGYDREIFARATKLAIQRATP